MTQEETVPVILELDAFLAHLEKERRLSGYTVRNYSQAIRDFSGWMKKNTRWDGEWEHLSPTQLKRFLIERQGSHSRRTIHNHFSALKTYSRYLQTRKLIKKIHSRECLCPNLINLYPSF